MGNCCTSEETSTEVNMNKPNGKKMHKKKKGVGNVPDSFAETFIESEDTGKLDLWDSPTKLSDDGVTDRDYFDDDVIELERKGKTMPLFKPKVVESLEPYLSSEAQVQLEKLGPFKYRKSELTSLNLKEEKLETRGVTQTYGDVRYIGQAIKNKDTLEGRGIAVYPDGAIYEGF